MELPEPDIQRRDSSRSSPRLPIGARRLRWGAVWAPLPAPAPLAVGQTRTPMLHSLMMFGQMVHDRMADILCHEPWSWDRWGSVDLASQGCVPRGLPWVFRALLWAP